MAHNKKRDPLLYLLINYKSVRSASQMFFLKGENTLHFLNFLTNGLCDSSASY